MSVCCVIPPQARAQDIMSSDDGLGGLAPTTPFAKHTAAKSNNRRAVPVHAEASTTKTATQSVEQAKKRARAASSSSSSAVEEVDQDVGRRMFNEARVTTNGNAATSNNHKGKGKAPVRKTAQRPAPRTNEPVEIVEVLDRYAPRSSPSKRNPNHSEPVTDLRREVARLEARLSNVQTQRDTLAQQLNDLHEVRMTEPEIALKLHKEQADARFSAQERTIQEQAAHLERVNAIARSGKGGLLQFITRDTAEQEKQAAKDEIARLQSVIQERDAVIKQKDKRISELEQAKEQLDRDLKLEIERSKTLAKTHKPSQPSGAGRQRGLLDDPKEIAKTKFYEDLTNLLVINIKWERSEFYPITKTDDTHYTCMYTYESKAGPSASRESLADVEPKHQSLSFNLIHGYDVIAVEENKEPDPPESMDDLEEKIKFIPLNLEQETLDFVDKLGFLREPFSFHKKQMPMFLDTLGKRMSVAVGDREESVDVEDDASVVDVEDDDDRQ